MEFVDSHCHLDDSQFDADRAAMLDRARAAGLKYLLSIGTGDGPPDLGCAIRLAEQHPFVYATAGVHPNDATKVDRETFLHLESLLRHPKVKALGEVGLDYHWDVPKELQMPVFERQLELAAAAHLPIIIHTRDAWADTMAVLRAAWPATGLPCLMHCFTGSVREAEECLELGFHLAFGGVLTFPKAQQVREAARVVPADRLLLETDSPYLAPVPHRGGRNEPAFVVRTAQVIADVRETSLEQLAAETTSNFETIFGFRQENSSFRKPKLH